jgi:hypothetical protein
MKFLVLTCGNCSKANSEVYNLRFCIAHCYLYNMWNEDGSTQYCISMKVELYRNNIKVFLLYFLNNQMNMEFVRIYIYFSW